jgi:hypothetical protein
MTFGSTLALKGALDEAHPGLKGAPSFEIVPYCSYCKKAVRVFERWIRREVWLQQIERQNLLDDSYGGTCSD